MTQLLGERQGVTAGRAAVSLLETDFGAPGGHALPTTIQLQNFNQGCIDKNAIVLSAKKLDAKDAAD